MSNGRTILLNEYKIEHFISVEHGTKEVSMSLFLSEDGKIGMAKMVSLTPDQARQIGQELITRANIIKEQEMPF